MAFHANGELIFWVLCGFYSISIIRTRTQSYQNPVSSSMVGGIVILFSNNEFDIFQKNKIKKLIRIYNMLRDDEMKKSHNSNARDEEISKIGSPHPSVAVIFPMTLPFLFPF